MAVGVMSASVAITADAVNNLSDAASSVVTFIGFYAAGKRADKEHPFGHGRIEYIAGMVVAALIIVMGLTLIREGVEAIIYPARPEMSAAVVVVLVASIGVKLLMWWYNMRMSRKIRSSALRSVARDSLSDVLATSVVLVSMIVVHFWGVDVDGICGLLVGVFVLYSGIKSARETISPLIGEAPDPEFVEEVRAIVLSHPKVIGMHKLHVHEYGPTRRCISLHAEVAATEELVAIHGIIDHIEHELHDKLDCEATIHIDPREEKNS